MYNKPKSIEFTNQMYKDKTGKNNPQAKPTLITNIQTKGRHGFGTFKDACIFLSDRASPVRPARDTNAIYDGQ